jgi:MFS family permease
MIDRTNLPLLVTLALGVFAGALDLGVLSLALPALADTFAIPGRDVAWVFTLYLFANVVSIPVMTKLSDVYGRRPIYIACLASRLGARHRSGWPLRSAIRKAVPAATAEPSIRYHAGAISFPVAPINAVATIGAVPPTMPIPMLKDTE